MTLKTISTINLVDASTEENVYIVIRASNDIVAIGISKERDGDVEIFLHPFDAQIFIRELKKALLDTTG